MATKTYQNRQYGFEIEIPDKWRCQSDSFFGKLGSKKEDGLYFTPSFFLIKVGSFTSSKGISDMQQVFRNYASIAGHKNVTLSSITVNHIVHVCASYKMGLNDAQKNKVTIDMTKQLMHDYRKEVGNMSLGAFLEWNNGHDSGPVVKEYWLTFANKRFNIFGGMGFGTVEEVSADFSFRQEEFDKVVSTFRLIN